MSRFPVVTETFILRELGAVRDRADVDVTVLSLFPGDDEVLHAAGRAWTKTARRPSPADVVGGILYWLRRRPFRLCGTFWQVFADHAAAPKILGKSLTTALLGLAHARTVEQQGIGHVHAHFASLPTLAAYVVHRLTGASYSVTPHAHDIFANTTGLRRRLRNAAFVVAISEYHWMHLQIWGARPESLIRMGCGIDLSEYEYRRVFEVTGEPRAVCVSSFKPYKGHRYLLQTMLDARLAHLRVTFIGDGPIRHEIEQLAADLGVAARCTFLGSLGQDEVREHIREADVLIQPSIVQQDGDTEGLPTTVIEAAALGTPVVATRLVGIPSLIADRTAGFLADPRDPGELADAIHDALTWVDLEEVRHEARVRVEERHDLRAVSQRLSAEFRSLARTAATRPPI